MDRADFQQQMEQEHREHDLELALTECFDKGVSKETMLTLIFETGSRFILTGEMQWLK